jgi:parallel beta-helix repeat protein
LLTSSNITLDGNTVLGAGNNGIYVRESDNVTVSNNVVDHAVGHGIYVKLCTVGITVTGNTVTRSGSPTSSLNKMGIYLSGVSGALVAGNTVEENSNSGIYLVDATNAVLVKGNTADNNAWQFQRGAPGIEAHGDGTTGNIVDGNVSFHNEDTGIQMYSGTSDNLVVNNLAYNNGDHGIDNYNAANMQIIGNTVYGNVTAGINLEGNTSTASTGGKIANNISVDNGINSPRTKGNIRIEIESLPGSSADYDFVRLSVPGTMFQWGSSFPKSLAESQATNPSLEAHGREADPVWMNQPARDFHTPLPIPDVAADFHLSGLSTAIGAANSAVTNDLGFNLGHDLEGDPRTSPWDSGAYEF